MKVIEQYSNMSRQHSLTYYINNELKHREWEIGTIQTVTSTNINLTVASYDVFRPERDWRLRWSILL